MSSPPSATYVPYLAYKSKRHSRNLSSSTAHLLPNQSPPPVSKPASGTASPTASFPTPKFAFNVEYDDDAASEATTPSFKNNRINGSGTVAVTAVPTIAGSFVSECGPSSSAWTPSDREMLSSSNGDTCVAPLPSVISSLPSPPMKKTSTFRRLPAKCRNSQTATHSRNASSSSVQPQTINSPQRAVKSLSVAESTSPDSANVSLPSNIQETVFQSSQPSVTYTSQILPVDSPSILKLSSSTNVGNGSALHDKPLPLIQSTLRKSPYRPGFQPKGVYRPLTDDFLEIRQSNRDGVDGGMKRIERTKLERRLEKLIALHFPPLGEDAHEKMRPRIRPLSHSSRRVSIFDLGSLKNINISDAGDLWKGIVSGKVMETAKNETRAAEQRITPWQDDAGVSKCPLCSASFHPLSNRKHHCRLCGRIICSLPVKYPQRKHLCSTLFVVDRQTRQIEEVGEGVDYGVRKRRVSGVVGPNAKQEEDSKFLQGIRICHDCRPTLLQQQYQQQAHVIPPFVDLYQKLVGLETDIENSLPKFQELLTTLGHDNQPTKEAIASRKQLLDSFAQYDKLAKNIRSLPCPNGFGSSQDRVQMAIATRANLFLQRNMLSLQSVPTLRSNPKAAADLSKSKDMEVILPQDMDATLAHSLQPLLEQESLLEAFIEEAQAQRKFEDVKSLKLNLAEIRREIERKLGVQVAH